MQVNTFKLSLEGEKQKLGGGWESALGPQIGKICLTEWRVYIKRPLESANR